MYGKLFSSMFDGSLRSRGPWEAIVTLQQLVILADQDGVVDMTCEAISSRTSIPLAIIEKGIAALEAPDPESRNPDDDGRRIVLLRPHTTWGWRIVNYGFYRNLRSEEDRKEKRREYHREYARTRRTKLKRSQQSVNKSQQASTPSQQVSNDVNRVTPSSKQYAVSRTTTTEDPRVTVVLSRYKELHPDSRLSLKTASKAVKKAPEQYTAQELVEAIEGNAADPWHAERGKHELSYVLRNEEKIDQFREIKHRQSKLMGVGGEVTVEELASIGIKL